MQEFLTCKEVSDKLKVPKSTVWWWCRTGKIPFYNAGHGKRYLIGIKDYEDFVANGYRKRKFNKVKI